MLERVKGRLSTSDHAKLKRAIKHYGSERAKTFFARALGEAPDRHAA